MSDFRKLSVWRKAHALTLNVHATAVKLRGSDNAALRGQMLRAAMSIPTNIVEGCGHPSAKEFGRFLGIAQKSASELEYHLLLGHELRIIGRGDFETLSAQTIEVRKMLYGLQSRVVASANSRPPKRSDSPN